MRSNSEIVIYQSPTGNIKIDVRLEDETVWLTQKLMAELFQVKPQNITIHLKNIYKEGELDEKATCKDFLQVQKEGSREVNRKQKFYNLDAIISVGYRIKSQVATQFRIWATKRLKDYIIKGFALNDARFKAGNSMNYFNELQERLREIRLSERFFYQKIKDIYTTSIEIQLDAVVRDIPHSFARDEMFNNCPGAGPWDIDLLCTGLLKIPGSRLPIPFRTMDLTDRNRQKDRKNARENTLVFQV